jgi:hypothetical protein
MLASLEYKGRRVTFAGESLRRWVAESDDGAGLLSIACEDRESKAAGSWVPGSDGGGRRTAPTSLRCSERRRAAKLAPFAALRQSRRVRCTKRAARAAAAPALLGAADLPSTHLPTSLRNRLGGFLPCAARGARGGQPSPLVLYVARGHGEAVPSTHLPASLQHHRGMPRKNLRQRPAVRGGSARLWAGGPEGASEPPSSAGLVRSALTTWLGEHEGASQAPSFFTLAARPGEAGPHLSERSERSERSELCGGPRDRAAEGSRAATGSAKPGAATRPQPCSLDLKRAIAHSLARADRPSVFTQGGAGPSTKAPPDQ